MPDAYPREQLFCLLDDARRKPVIWVGSPRGTGKTTLAASYVVARKLSHLWLRLDEGDADLATFYSNLRLALKQSCPKGFETLPEFTQREMRNLTGFARHFFRSLCTFLPRPCLLVIDDYHTVAPESPLHRVMGIMLEEIPQQITVLVASCSEPPACLSRMQANGQITRLGWKQLLLNVQETEAIVRLKGVTGFNDAHAIRTLHERIQGWVAALALILEQTPKRALLNTAVEESANRILVDYFTLEVLKDMRAEQMTLLLKTAFLPWMTARMARELTGDASTEQLLTELHRANCFIQMDAVTPPIYRYCPLFRTFLIARARNELGKNMTEDLFQKATRLILEQAEFMLGIGDEGRSLEMLQQALALSKECARDRPTIPENLCVLALEKGIEVNYVQQWIKQQGMVPDSPPIHLSNWPWPLQIYVLGRFTLVRSGVPLDTKGKVKRPLELLKTLIALGGRDVAKVKLMDWLWPDADGDAASRSLDITIHRLRRLLKLDQALLVSDGSVSLNNRYCWVDLWALERTLGKVEAAFTQPPFDNDLLRSLGDELFAHYRGIFLPGEFDYPWVLQTRQHLQQRLVRVASRLGQHWEASGQWTRAATCYERGIETDHLAVKLYQPLMTLFKRQGRFDEALAVHERYRVMLQTSFRGLPSTNINSIAADCRREVKELNQMHNNVKGIKEGIGEK